MDNWIIRVENPHKSCHQAIGEGGWGDWPITSITAEVTGHYGQRLVASLINEVIRC